MYVLPEKYPLEITESELLLHAKTEIRDTTVFGHFQSSTSCIVMSLKQTCTNALFDA